MFVMSFSPSISDLCARKVYVRHWEFRKMGAGVIMNSLNLRNDSSWGEMEVDRQRGRKAREDISVTCNARHTYNEI